MPTDKREAKVVTKPSVGAQWAGTKLDPNESGMLQCPFCPWSPVTGSLGEQKNALGHHLDEQHETKLEFARLHWADLGWEAYEKMKELEAREEQEIDFEGMLLGESFDEFDYLYVGKEVKDKVRGRGGVLRWASAKNVQRYKDWGMRVVERGDAEMPSQQSREDTTARANELVLMEMPAPLREKRSALRQQKIRSQGATVGRAEDLQNSQSDLEKNAYEHYRRQGVPHENAMRLSRNVEGRVASGEISFDMEPGENRYTHRR